MIKSDQNHPRLAPFCEEIPMILRKSDEAMASSASIVATAMEWETGRGMTGRGQRGGADGEMGQRGG